MESQVVDENDDDNQSDRLHLNNPNTLLFDAYAPRCPFLLASSPNLLNTWYHRYSFYNLCNAVLAEQILWSISFSNGRTVYRCFFGGKLLTVLRLDISHYSDFFEFIAIQPSLFSVLGVCNFGVTLSNWCFEFASLSSRWPKNFFSRTDFADDQALRILSFLCILLQLGPTFFSRFCAQSDFFQKGSNYCSS